MASTILRLEADNGVVLVVSTDQIKMKVIRSLASGLTEIKKKHSLYTEYPLKDKETTEQWEERVGAALVEKQKRKDGEDFDEYLTRRLAPDLSNHEVLAEVLLLIAQVFAQDRVNEEFVDTVCYPAAKALIKEVLMLCDLSTKGFE